MSISTIILRTLFAYISVLIVLRLMGKREIGKLSIFDLVVSIMMADLAVLVIEDEKVSLIRGITPILVLMITQISLSFITLKNKRIRELVEGRPVILIKNGKIMDNEMKKQRYSIDDLLTQVREKSISSIAEVDMAILETSGKLSVFSKVSKSPVTKEDLGIKTNEFEGIPIPLVADGRTLSRNLKKINKDELWLKKQLAKRGHIDINDVYYASIDATGDFFIDPKNR